MELPLVADRPWASGSFPLFASLVCVGVAGILFVREIASRKVHPNEPPVVRPSIPFIGHVLGMILHGGRYVKSLGSRHGYPIFTLPMPGSRLYIVKEPSLAASVQRSKTLSFSPIIPEVTQRILGLDKATVNIVKTNLEGEGGVKGFIPEIHDLVYSALAPGESLDKLTKAASEEMATAVKKFGDTLVNDSSGGVIEDLLYWTQHIVTIATSRFLYGPENPIVQCPGLEDDFWTFDRGIGQLLIDMAPSITARGAYFSRERLVKAITEYIEDGRYKTGSEIIQRRIEVAKKHGFSTPMTARSELSFLFAGIVNTTITSFWMIVHIFARPALLETVRGEIKQTLSKCETGDGKDPDSISAKKLRESCPVFLSTYRETLRFGSDNSSTRYVKEDTILAETHFLRAGSVVQIAGGIMHGDKTIWGDDASDFNPMRFCNNINKKATKSSSVHPAAFRGFGGGTTLCPGRHFATDEILGLVAQVVLRFNINDSNNNPISIPQKKDNVLPVHILEPMGILKARIQLRKSSEHTPLGQAS